MTDSVTISYGSPQITIQSGGQNVLTLSQVGRPGLDAKQEFSAVKDGDLIGGDTLFWYVFTGAVTFDPTLCTMRLMVGPTSPRVIPILKNGVSCGQITVAAGSLVGVVSFTAAAFAAGDVILIQAPNPRDNTMAGVLVLLAGV